MPRVTEREPSATKLPDEFDPFAQATIESPYAFYRSLRTHAPVYRVPKADYYLVSRHADVKSVVMNPGTYSSNLTSIVMAQTDGSMASLDVGQLGIGPVDVLAVQDPPAHTRQRALTHPRFAMRTVRGREQSVRAQACELLDAALESREETNWMKKFASLLPMAVIIDIIGLPLEDRDQLKAWSDLAIALLSGTSTTEQMATHAMGALSLFQYLQARFEEARQDPKDDLLGLLAEATGAGDDSLTVEESVSILLQMIIAGNESTASLIGSATRLLAEKPELQEALRQDPSRIPLFVEEAVRLESPFQGHFRKTREASELAGVSLPEGARLMVLWASGNRDERVFESPDTIDLDRPNLRAHLSFGHGIHLCIGAQLARLEAKVSIEELLKRTTQFEMAGPARHVSSVFVRTPAELPLALQTSR
jgi:cytochrome P450